MKQRRRKAKRVPRRRDHGAKAAASGGCGGRKRKSVGEPARTRSAAFGAGGKSRSSEFPAGALAAEGDAVHELHREQHPGARAARDGGARSGSGPREQWKRGQEAQERPQQRQQEESAQVGGRAGRHQLEGRVGGGRAQVQLVHRATAQHGEWHAEAVPARRLALACDAVAEWHERHPRGRDGPGQDDPDHRAAGAHAREERQGQLPHHRASRDAAELDQ
eukprot:scaffold1499_cov255-Pinguiococcus_pyrenoidosus.AAC.19